MDIAELDRSLEKSIKSVLLTVWTFKFSFVLVGALVGGGLYVASLSIPPTYEGSTLLLNDQSSMQQLPDGSRKLPETTAALARVAESEQVVIEAINKVGLANLVADLKPRGPSLSSRVRARVFPSIVEPKLDLSPTATFLPQIKAALNVRGEQNSDIIQIAFRNRDPTVAANFANAVAQTFVDRQIALQSRPGAAEFFNQQRQRFNDEIARSTAELERFSSATGIFAAEDQRQLMLKRLNDMGAALATTRGTISEMTGQRQALAEQLHRLAPVTHSSYIAGLVDTLSADRNAPAPRPGDSRVTDDRTGDPPLLLIRVYQDSMVALFKINADLVGARDLLRQQLDEEAGVKTELAHLSQNEHRFVELSRAVEQATYNSNLYARRMVDEEINAASSAAKFSSVRVLQKATIPVRPVSPNQVLVIAVAAMLGGAAGLGAAFLRQSSSQARHARRQRSPELA